MQIYELILLAIGLAMDAFAVSICKGLSLKKVKFSNCITAGAYFGVFQAFMPVIGFLLATTFSQLISAIDHWIAFILLSLIGLSMLKEARGCADEHDASFSIKVMLPLAVATSIDAMAVGVTFAFLKTNIVLAASLIGVITFVFSFFGVKIGNVFGCRFKQKAEVFGGAILIFMGIKILLEHLNII